jgi:hypothetical protein
VCADRLPFHIPHPTPISSRLAARAPLSTSQREWLLCVLLGWGVGGAYWSAFSVHPPGTPPPHQHQHHQHQQQHQRGRSRKQHADASASRRRCDGTGESTEAAASAAAPSPSLAALRQAVRAAKAAADAAATCLSADTRSAEHAEQQLDALGPRPDYEAITRACDEEAEEAAWERIRAADRPDEYVSADWEAADEEAERRWSEQITPFVLLEAAVSAAQAERQASASRAEHAAIALCEAREALEDAEAAAVVAPAAAHLIVLLSAARAEGEAEAVARWARVEEELAALRTQNAWLRVHCAMEA